LAGEGVGLAMTEAYVLAGELHRARGDVGAAFRSYESRLRTFIEGKQKSARAFATSFAPRTAFGIWLRNVATKLLVIPPMADLLIGGSVRDKFDLPDYEM
jgi:2-polyprenyl-6-methoxyphenol hydroxylase-like FAD-dependent oxidoreductase